MALFNTIRVVSFIAILLFALIVLGISGHWVSLLQGFVSSYSNPAAFALAVSVITWAFLGPLPLISMLRKGSILSWVVVELAIVGLLWVLWLAAAAYVTSMTAGASLNCDYAFLTPEAESICRQYQALQAFSWLNWLILFMYLVLLLVFAIKAQGKGHSVWTSDVTDLQSFSAGGGSTSNLAPATNNAAYQQNNATNQQNSQYTPSMQQSSIHPNSAQQHYAQPGVAQV